MNRKTGLWIGLAAIAFIAFLIYTTLGQQQYRVEVCMEFAGRSACRTASGSTEDEAMRTALDNACALISSGVTDSRLCTTSKPKSVRRLEDR